MRTLSWPFPVLAMLLFASGCARQNWQPPTYREILLGTFVSVVSYDSSLVKDSVDAAVDSAFRFIRRLEHHTNPFDPASEISRINDSTRLKRHFVLSPILQEILPRALQISQETGGAYDPTLWPVFALWHFATDSARVPPRQLVREALKKVNYRWVSFRDGTVLFERPGMGIDLSGISKGFAVEKARTILRRHGLRHFIIDAGGNLGIEWGLSVPVNVYIRHPRREGEFFGFFPVTRSCGVATSGDYQNYFLQNDTLYHHILNPRTGYPARGLVSVTVLAQDATTADGLSTALFVMGREQGKRFVEMHEGLEALFVFQQGDSLAYEVTSGLKSVFQPLRNGKKTD